MRVGPDLILFAAGETRDGTRTRDDVSIGERLAIIYDITRKEINQINRPNWTFRIAFESSRIHNPQTGYFIVNSLLNMEYEIITFGVTDHLLGAVAKTNKIIILST